MDHCILMGMGRVPLKVKPTSSRRCILLIHPDLTVRQVEERLRRYLGAHTPSARYVSSSLSMLI